MISEVRMLVISHAGIRSVNRSVYRIIKKEFPSLKMVVPASLVLTSGQNIVADAPQTDDPELLMLPLVGRNPRTYFYEGLHDVLDACRPDTILLENDPVSKLGVVLHKWCKRTGCNLLCQTYENTDRGVLGTLRHQGLKAIWKNIPIHFLNFIMAKKVTGVFVVNNDSRYLFQDRYHYQNVDMIPLGYDIGIFFPDDGRRKLFREKLNISPNQTAIAYFGRMVPQKGVHYLIEALKPLESFDWILVLDHFHDSENDYVNHIKRVLRAQGFEDRVRYFKADHIEIADYMRACDITVSPSVTTPGFKEQYGRAVQEAMACGCVTVVSDSGHLQYLVGEPELVFPEGDVVALKKILTGLLSDPRTITKYRRTLSNRAAHDLTTERQAYLVSQAIKRISHIDTR